MALDLSVVINTRDHADDLRRCLESLARQTLDPERWEVVVVDDGSHDSSTARVVQGFKTAACRLVRLEPSGRAKARNRGIEAAQGRHILFMGDDIVAAYDLLAQHLSAHESHPRCAVLGYREEAVRAGSPAFMEWWDNLAFHLIQDPGNAGFGYFYTCNVSVERQSLLDAGGFDENFIRYGWEDLDLGLRLEKIGVRLVYCRMARALHNHPNVSLDALCRRERELGFSSAYFIEKWPDEPGVQKLRFWTGDAAQTASGPGWRKTLGRALIHIAEFCLPRPSILRPLYCRLLTSCRFDGLREGAAHYAPILERLRREAP
ncbi:glycosyltransferase [Candidatus Sumerlaeota bacterium]|nr:glycosyltransferase [Candidatus Sumerlaeota bacterium]